MTTCDNMSLSSRNNLLVGSMFFISNINVVRDSDVSSQEIRCQLDLGSRLKSRETLIRAAGASERITQIALQQQKSHMR